MNTNLILMEVMVDMAVMVVMVVMIVMAVMVFMVDMGRIKTHGNHKKLPRAIKMTDAMTCVSISTPKRSISLMLLSQTDLTWLALSIRSS